MSQARDHAERTRSNAQQATIEGRTRLAEMGVSLATRPIPLGFRTSASSSCLLAEPCRRFHKASKRWGDLTQHLALDGPAPPTAGPSQD